MATGIYKILNPKNKIYIGCSIDIENRFKTYSYCDCKNQSKLYNSLKEYGHENHTFEIIEECDEKNFDIRERYWINYYDSYNNGLNGNKGGVGILHHTNNTKEKISKARKGWVPSKERGEKIGNKIKGRKYSEEHKEKISKALKGTTKPFKGRISPNKGNTYSNEIKNKMSKLKQGIIYSQETRKKMSNNQWKKKKIAQYDLNGNFIKQWPSITEAKKFIGYGDIGACIRGKQKTAAGYKWKVVTS